MRTRKWISITSPADYSILNGCTGLWVLVFQRSYATPDIDESELEAELEALGDEIGLDADSSYLDEIAAPPAPSREPGADSINPVRASYSHPFSRQVLKLCRLM